MRVLFCMLILGVSAMLVLMAPSSTPQTVEQTVSPAQPRFVITSRHTQEDPICNYEYVRGESGRWVGLAGSDTWPRGENPRVFLGHKGSEEAIMVPIPKKRGTNTVFLRAEDPLFLGTKLVYTLVAKDGYSIASYDVKTKRSKLVTSYEEMPPDTPTIVAQYFRVLRKTKVQQAEADAHTFRIGGLTWLRPTSSL